MAVFDLMIDGTGGLVFLLAAAAVLFFFSLFLPRWGLPRPRPFIFSEEPYTALPLGEVPPHFLLPSRDGFIYCAID
jgi:hypothetical protein